MTMDGSGNQGDALLVGGQPSSDKQNPSTPQVWTQEQVNERHAKLDRQIAAVTKERDTFKSSHETLSTQLTELQRRIYEMEENTVMDDPEALTTLRAERKTKAEAETKVAELAEREAKITGRETELTDIIEQHKILRRTELAAEVAVEKGVSMDAILKLAKVDTREAYLEVAEVLPKVKELPDLILSSSRTNRGGIDLSSLSPKDRVQERDRRLRAGIK